MNKHWEDVKNVSDIMIYFLEKVDPDEIELDKNLWKMDHAVIKKSIKNDSGNDGQCKLT